MIGSCPLCCSVVARFLGGTLLHGSFNEEMLLGAVCQGGSSFVASNPNSSLWEEERFVTIGPNGNKRWRQVKRIITCPPGKAASPSFYCALSSCCFFQAVYWNGNNG